MGGMRLGTWPVRALCPACGVVTSHEVTRRAHGTRPKALRCKSCGHEWEWVAKPAKVQLSECERRKPKAQREVRACLWCGREFHPLRPSQVCCCERCRERASRDPRAGLLVLAAQARELDARLRAGDV